MARRFTADASTPHAAEWDEKHIFPRASVKAAAELGFGAIYVSEASGGIGLGRLEAALIMEAMAYGCPSTSAVRKSVVLGKSVSVLVDLGGCRIFPITNNIMSNLWST